MNREQARRLIGQEMASYAAARAIGDGPVAWRALEKSHIVSQPFLALHMASHWAMLRYALAERDMRESIGQCARLVLAPLGAITGRIPVGNTGRANVSAFQPMPVPDDLKDVLESLSSNSR